MRRTGHVRQRSAGPWELRYSLSTDPLPKGADRRLQGRHPSCRPRSIERRQTGWTKMAPHQLRPPGRSGYGVVTAKRQETGK
jgi:hypothetical protein